MAKKEKDFPRIKRTDFMTAEGREEFDVNKDQLDYSLLGKLTSNDFERIRMQASFAGRTMMEAGKRLDVELRPMTLENGMQISGEKVRAALIAAIVHMRLQNILGVETLLSKNGTQPEVFIAFMEGGHAMASVVLQSQISQDFPTMAQVRAEIRDPELALPENEEFRQMVKYDIMEAVQKSPVFQISPITGERVLPVDRQTVYGAIMGLFPYFDERVDEDIMPRLREAEAARGQTRGPKHTPNSRKPH